ncbi:uncharacterized protein C2845_PM05G30710 [Panicum miliaceum]|uniref:Uncharacterized protein n=1 Tax=Panicum miliaceum TaxID=4540 RepID=A0A3L6T1V8_PANMI|nr:uncharacterized protein C2845_PM05G30710 [Panicum miliaceum]
MAADGLQGSLDLRGAVRGVMLQDARIEAAWALEQVMRLSETGMCLGERRRGERCFFFEW